MSHSTEPETESSIPSDYPTDALIEVDDLSFSYDLGVSNVLKKVSLKIPEHQVTTFVGPSGSGKSTLLRCFNRMNDRSPTALITNGVIKIAGEDIYGPSVDPMLLRQQVGMVFQKANPLPKSIYDNIAFGLRIAGERSREILDRAVEENLRIVGLWDEVKDQLKASALTLSDGQQQRLCIARVLAIDPEILLMDEPCSALEPAAVSLVEDLMLRLLERITIVVVTPNMQQATRISDHTAFFYRGELIEFGHTSQLFTNPTNKQTEDYISGKFG